MLIFADFEVHILIVFFQRYNKKISAARKKKKKGMLRLRNPGLGPRRENPLSDILRCFHAAFTVKGLTF